jgi:hypothetical protein
MEGNQTRGPVGSRWFSLWSLLTVTVALGAGSLLRRIGVAQVGDVGTIQRVSLGALNLWMLTLAVRHGRATPALDGKT